MKVKKVKQVLRETNGMTLEGFAKKGVSPIDVCTPAELITIITEQQHPRDDDDYHQYLMDKEVLSPNTVSIAALVAAFDWETYPEMYALGFEKAINRLLVAEKKNCENKEEYEQFIKDCKYYLKELEDVFSKDLYELDVEKYEKDDYKLYYLDAFMIQSRMTEVREHYITASKAQRCFVRIIENEVSVNLDFYTERYEDRYCISVYYLLHILKGLPFFDWKTVRKRIRTYYSDF